MNVFTANAKYSLLKELLGGTGNVVLTLAVPVDNSGCVGQHQGLI